MPPWKDKGRTTKAWREVAEKLSKDNADIFPMGVKDGIIKKRFKGAVEFMMKFHGMACIRTGRDDEPINDFVSLVEQVVEAYSEFLSNKEVSAIAEAAKKKQQAEEAAIILDAAIGSRSAKEIRELAKAKSKASSDSGGSSERGSITSSDNGSNEKKFRSPTFASNQIIAAINDVSNLSQKYETTKSEKLETKRMKYQVEEKQLALEELERQDRHALFENFVAQNNQN